MHAAVNRIARSVDVSTLVRMGTMQRSRGVYYADELNDKGPAREPKRGVNAVQIFAARKTLFSSIEGVETAGAIHAGIAPAGITNIYLFFHSVQAKSFLPV